MIAVKIIIFDVEHGFCSFIKGPNGHTILIDCGKTENFSPIKYIIKNELLNTVTFNDYRLTEFILTHPHDDHIEDIDRLISELPPAMMRRENRFNWNLLKVGDADKYENLDKYSEWQTIYNSSVENLPNFGVDIIDSYNLSPQEAYRINKNNYVNNSSIPVIINFEGTQYSEKILFGGDLMKEGLLELLKNENFKKNLKYVDFFVTSHHGHSSGYCKEVFDVMGGLPILNIVSAHHRDESVESSYSSLASGIEVNGEKRYMLSTRQDGSIIIEITDEGKFYIYTQHFETNLNTQKYYW